jgi:hypothetical protein
MAGRSAAGRQIPAWGGSMAAPLITEPRPLSVGQHPHRGNGQIERGLVGWLACRKHEALQGDREGQGGRNLYRLGRLAVLNAQELGRRPINEPAGGTGHLEQAPAGPRDIAHHDVRRCPVRPCQIHGDGLGMGEAGPALQLPRPGARGNPGEGRLIATSCAPNPRAGTLRAKVPALAL